MAVLLERLGSENAASPSVLLIDVRRPDERVFYGAAGALCSSCTCSWLTDRRRPAAQIAQSTIRLPGSIPGSFSVPAEQVPRAMAMGPEEWFRTFRFLRPQPHQLIVLHSRAVRAAGWG